MLTQRVEHLIHLYPVFRPAQLKHLQLDLAIERPFRCDKVLGPAADNDLAAIGICIVAAITGSFVLLVTDIVNPGQDCQAAERQEIF